MTILFKYYKMKEIIGSRNQYLNTLKTEYEIKRIMEGNKRKKLGEIILEKIDERKNKIKTPLNKKDVDKSTEVKEEVKDYKETKDEIKETENKENVQEKKINSEEEMVKKPKDNVEEPDLSKYQEKIEKNEQVKQAATGVNKNYKDTEDIIIDIQKLIEMRKNKK